MPFLLVLVAAIVHQGEGILVKKHDRESSGGFVFTSLISLCSMAFFLVSLFVSREQAAFNLELFIFALLGGLCYASASYFTLVSLNSGPYAITMLVLSFSFVFQTLYGFLFLQEEVTVLAVIGIILTAISVYLCRGNTNNSAEKKKASLLWIVALLISFFGSGFLGVLMKVQQLRFEGAHDNLFMVICLGTSSLLLFIIGMIKDRSVLSRNLKRTVAYASLAGLCNGATNALHLVVNSLLPLSLASPLSSGAKIVAVFAVSRLVFKEKILLRRVFGLVLGVAAIVLLSIN